MHSLWGYVGKIRVNPRFEQVKILVIGDLFPQRSVSMERSCSSGTKTSPMRYKGNEGGAREQQEACNVLSAVKGL